MATTDTTAHPGRASRSPAGLRGRLLELYRDLRVEHTAWVQRIHAVLFHQGAPRLSGEGGLRSEAGRAELAVITAEHLSPAGQIQVEVALDMLDKLDKHLDAVRRQLVRAARQPTGAKVLTDRLYRVASITALAMCAWLAGAGRYSSTRKAVRFTGLDVTMYSPDGKRSPGHPSRQGPPVLRWCVYQAGKTHARRAAPDHAYYTAVHERIDGKRAAISEARTPVRQACRILTDLGDDALTAC